MDWTKISSFSHLLSYTDRKIDYVRIGSISDLIKFAALPSVKELWKNEKINKLFDSAEEFLQFLQIDPTFDGQIEPKYFRWLLYAKFKEPEFFDISGIEALTQYLNIYEKVKSNLPENKRNLNKDNFPKIEDLYDIIKDYIPKEGEEYISNSQKKKEIYKNDIKKIYDKDDWKIEIPKNYEATCLLGANTQWCISSNTSDYYYKHYSAKGPIYVITQKSSNTKYAILPDSDEFRNPEDEWGYIDWLYQIPNEEKKEINNFIYNNIWNNPVFDNNQNKEELVIELYNNHKFPIRDKFDLDNMDEEIRTALKPELIKKNPLINLYFDVSSPTAQLYIMKNPTLAINWVKDPTENLLLASITPQGKASTTDSTDRDYSGEYLARNIRYAYGHEGPSKELIEKAVELNPAVISYLKPESITEDIVSKVINKNIKNVDYLPRYLQTQEMWDKAVESNPLMVSMMPKEFQSKELWDRAYEKDNRIFRQLPIEFQTEDRWMAHLEKNPYAIRYIPKQFRSKELYENFINKFPTYIRSIPKKLRTEERWNAAFNDNPKLIKYMPEEFQKNEMWVSAIAKYPSLFDRLPEEFKIKEVYNAILERRPSLINKIPKEVKEVKEDNKTNTTEKYIDEEDGNKQLKDMQTQEQWNRFISKKPHKLDDVPEQFKTKSFYETLLNTSIHWITRIPREYQTQELWDKGISQFPNLLRVAPKEFVTKDVINKVLLMDPAFVPVEYQTEEAWINYIQNTTKNWQVSNAALRIPEQLHSQRLFDIIAEKSPESVHSFPIQYQTQEMWDRGIEVNPSIMRYLLGRDDIVVRDTKHAHTKQSSIDWTKIIHLTDLNK